MHTQGTKTNPKKSHTLLTWAGIIIGSLLTSYSYAALIIPNDMLDGGIAGFGMIMNKVFGLPPGMSGLALTVVIFFIGLVIMGLEFGAKTLVASILSPLSLDFFLKVVKLPALTDDPLLAVFYGGVLCGGGLGIVFSCGAATGGGDTIAQIFRKVFHVPIGRTILVMDGIIMSVALFFYGPEQVMYSMLFIFVGVKVINLILNGTQANQQMLIISDRIEEIKTKILVKISRGVTVINAKGGYTDQPRDMLMTVISKKQAPDLKRAILELDPKAFLIIGDVHQCLGEGFDTLPPSQIRLPFRKTGKKPTQTRTPCPMETCSASPNPSSIDTDRHPTTT